VWLCVAQVVPDMIAGLTLKPGEKFFRLFCITFSAEILRENLTKSITNCKNGSSDDFVQLTKQTPKQTISTNNFLKLVTQPGAGH